MRAFAAAFLLACAATAQAQTYYVATDGANVPANGTSANPWASIEYAIDQVPDGATILVRPGTYNGRQRIDRAFASGVTVRSETPYQARLRNTGTVMTVWDAEGVTIEGFDIAHAGPGAGAIVVHVQDVGAETRRIVLRDNILHDSYNNDILKVNNGASDVRIVGNVFYNQGTSDEHIDANSVEDVVIEDNVFFNDYAASGRAIDAGASSFIVVKDSNGTDDEYLGARNVTIRRNVFLHWEGSAGSNFVLFGEDGTANFEADGALVENNLFLGNGTVAMRAPFGVKGSRNIVFRANTTAGDLPSNAFALRFNREVANMAVEGVSLHNNIWSDPTGTMNDFSDTLAGDVASFTLSNNLYWNGGAALPQDGSDSINIANDAAARTGDPALGANAGAASPFWIPSTSSFNGGHATIRAAFVDLVQRYGVPGANGAGIGEASAAQMPQDDILGNPRGSPPLDLGAVERAAALDLVFRDGFEQP